MGQRPRPERGHERILPNEGIGGEKNKMIRGFHFCSSPATAVMAVAGLFRICVYQLNSSRLFLMKSLNTASTTGTETELPNCL